MYIRLNLGVEHDPAKSDRNLRERGIPSSLAAEFEFDTSIEFQSNRDGEERFLALGQLAGRIHALVYTKRGEKVRVIRLRRASKQEVKRYEEAKSIPDRRGKS
jgi:uncharacterized DUF497 family protein